ncbi:hypothetical protein ACFVUT_18480 [Streptomyces sp. NPDC058051]|uniref:hypothetical protein n=1 Tax=Streptomyces sp. NPDC058051 TaxID=3346315 RepID=UPI0036F02B2A
MNGQRVVLSAVLPHLQVTALDEIQRQVAPCAHGDAEQLPELAGARLIQRLPLLIDGAAYGSRIRPLRTRAATIGSFAVTSLSHSVADRRASSAALALGHVRVRFTGR